MDPVAISIGADEKRVNDEAVLALSKCSDLFQRAGELVRVVEHLDDGRLSPRIETLPDASLREKLADLVEFRNVSWTRVHPPDWCVRAVAARSNWKGVRRLQSLVEYPVLLRSGQVLQNPGYDPDSFLLYQPSGSFLPVPTSPTEEELQKARDRLLDLVVDFPFAQPVHKAAWLAGALTMFARPGYDGSTPFFCIDGNVRGSGKSLLCDVAAMIATGRRAPRTTQVSDEAEERKRITAVARAGDSLILIDNIAKPFGNGSFDSALTSTTWKERLLGQSEIQSFPLLTVWWGTGNNIQFRAGADTARRTLHIRLLSPEQNPESRTDFKHPNLIAHVLSNRPQLVADCLTMLRAHAVAVKAGTAPKLKSWGSFEGWSHVVRGAIVLAGLPDPLEAHEELARLADTTANAHADLVLGWLDMCEQQNAPDGCTAREALEWLKEDLQAREENMIKELRFTRLHDALGELSRCNGRPLPDVNALGCTLRAYRDRTVEGYRLESGGKQSAKGGGQRWKATKR